MAEEEDPKTGLGSILKPLDRLVSSPKARHRYDGGVLLICVVGVSIGRTWQERLAFLGVYILYTLAMGSIDAIREARAHRVRTAVAEQSRLTGEDASSEWVSTE